MSKGKDAAQVVEETATRVLEQQAQFIDGVNRGIAAADRGELVDHSEVVNVGTCKIRAGENACLTKPSKCPKCKVVWWGRRFRLPQTYARSRYF